MSQALVVTTKTTRQQSLPGSAPRRNTTGKRKPKRRNGNRDKTLIPYLGASNVVQAPVAKSRVRRSRVPSIKQIGTFGDIQITHREYVNELLGSVGFTATQLALNPGLSAVFPWLSGVAQRYESYHFISLATCFETESSTAAKGSVMQGVDFDPSDPSPENKTQLMAYRSSVRSPPWNDSRCSLLREDLSKRSSYYVRTGALTSNQDIKLYDTGNWYVCTQGQADATNVGELYVEYTVKLMTPQLNAPGAGQALGGIFSGTSNAAPYSTKTGLVPATVISSGTTTSLSTFTFSQPWQGYITITLTGTGITGTAPSGTATIVEGNDVVNTAGTSSIAFYTVVADINQTFILSTSNTTITSAVAVFGQADI